VIPSEPSITQCAYRTLLLVAPNAARKSYVDLARNALAFAREFGVRRFAQEAQYRLVNRFHERRLGIETSGMVELASLGVQNQDSIEYTPIGYAALYCALKRIPLPASEISFLDYGCGKGRTLAVAGTFPFRKIMGVELSEQLTAAARSNVRRMRHRKAPSIEVVTCDAGDFQVPDDTNLIHFFNPFHGKTLEKVVKNIVASHAASPRTMYIIYFNKIHFERIINAEGYRVVKLIHGEHFYPNYSCGIYELTGPEAAGGASDGAPGR
jgi:predicted RNA methylase